MTACFHQGALGCPAGWSGVVWAGEVTANVAAHRTAAVRGTILRIERGISSSYGFTQNFEAPAESVEEGGDEGGAVGGGEVGGLFADAGVDDGEVELGGDGEE